MNLITENISICFSNLDWKYFSQIIIIILGWWIVHKLSWDRDNLKLKKENGIKAIDEAIKMLEEIILLGVQYHINTRDESKEFEIKNKIQNFNAFIYSIESLIDSKDKILECITSLRKVRQAITSKHFEDEHNQPVTSSNIVLKEIADIHLSFRQNLNEVKFSLFTTKK